MRLEGKVALISGGASGMGAAEANLFSKEGAKVVVCDINEEAGRQVEAQIIDAGGTAFYLHLDVTKEIDWQKAVEATVSKLGKLNVLVNNAGISGPPGYEDLSQATWDRVMEVNSTGVFLGTKTVIPEMKRAGGGSIVNISSQMGIVGWENAHPAYQASKGSVRILTKSTAIQYAKDNIRCNSVHPGPIDTPMSHGLRTQQSYFDQVISKVPLGRIGHPDEVAYGVLYLASDEAAYLTGSELVIDGGWVAQ